jgi:hypothetical protein
LAAAAELSELVRILLGTAVLVAVLETALTARYGLPELVLTGRVTAEGRFLLAIMAAQAEVVLAVLVRV